MSSAARTSAKFAQGGWDQAIFFLAAAGALGTIGYFGWAAAGSPQMAHLSLAIVLLGGLVSWWTRPRPAIGRPLCFGLALLAGWFWRAHMLRVLPGLAEDPGLALGLHLTVLPVAASFLMARVEAVAFALVPGLTLFGLSTATGNADLARTGFIIFLPLALVIIGYGTISSGAALVAPGTPAEPYARQPKSGFGGWRARHWAALAASILVVMLVGELLYLPLAQWAKHQRLRVVVPGTTLAGARGLTRPRLAAPQSTYPVGRGPVNPTPNPVMQITGSYQTYWRGEVFDQYLGGAWSRSEAGAVQARLSSPPGGSVLDFSRFQASQAARPAEHAVTALVDLPPVFFAPGEVHKLTLQPSRWRPQARTDDVVSLFPRPRRRPEGVTVVLDGYGSARALLEVLPKGATYRVVSLPFEPEEKNRKPTLDSRLSTLAPRPYLKIPFESNRVADLARTIVGKQTDPRRRLALLAAYLQEHCYYRLDAPAIPRGQDAVDYFIFTQKIGYCDLFASSLAVMARAVGIPTRLVTGYAFPVRAKGGTGLSLSYQLREADAHAWVEAYVPSAEGWLTVDPTPAADPSRSPLGGVRYRWLRFAALWRADPFTVTSLIVLALVILALAWLVLSKRIVIHTGLGSLEGDPQSVVISAYLRMCRLLHQRGHRRGQSQTPLEYLVTLESQTSDQGSGVRDRGSGPEARLARRPSGGLARRPFGGNPKPETRHEMLAPVRALTETFLDARYGPGPVSEETAQIARQSLAAVREAMQRNRSKHK